MEQEPPSAAVVFGDRLAVVRRFAESLAREGERRGLIGPLEVPRLWSRHIINCGVIAPLFETGNRVADVGSGGGLPGLVLASARPDVEWVLIEPMERRVRWLQEQSDELELDNVEIFHGRSEQWSPPGAFDAVTARAVSALRTLLPWTAPLLRDGGELLLMKGRNAEEEIAAAQKALKKFGARDVRVETVGEGLAEEATRLVRATVRRS